MTERRQFCPKGHDTFECGRDASYRCLRCKREAASEARAARRAEEEDRARSERQRRTDEWRKVCADHLARTGWRLPGHIE